jgi:hypothetical protein
MAAVREVKIRLSAEDAGATQAANQLTKALERMPREAVFSIDFRKEMIAQRVNETVAKMQREADRHQVMVEARLIEKEARTQLFGGPLRTVNRSDDEQAARDQMATSIRDYRAQSQARRQAPLSAGDFSRGESATAAAGGAEAVYNKMKGTASLTNQISAGMQKMGRVFVQLEVAVDSLNAGASAYKLTQAYISGGYKEQVKYANELRSNLEAFPIFGRPIVELGEKINAWTIGWVTGEQAYVEKLTEATAELEKQTALMAARAKAQKDAIQHAKEVAGSVGVDNDPNQSESERRTAKLAEERQKLAESLRAPGLTKNGQLTDTGREVQAEGLKRIANEEATYNREAAEKTAAAMAKAHAEQQSLTDSFNDRMIRLQRDAQQEQLTLAGNGFSARLQAIKAAAEDEKTELYRQRVQQQTDLNQSDPQYKLAEQRQLAQQAAVDAKANAQVQAEVQRENRERIIEAAKSAGEVYESQIRTAMNTLKASGRTVEAEALGVYDKYQARLREIDEQMRQSLQQHGERSAQIRAQAEQERAAAGAEAQSELTGVGRANIHYTNGLVGAQAAGLLTGVREESESHRIDPNVELGKETLKVLKDMRETLKKISRGSGPGQLILGN